MWFWPSQQYTQAFSAVRTGRCSVSSGVVFESSTLWFSQAPEWAAAGHSPPLSFPAGAWPCWRISEQRCSTSPGSEQNLGKGETFCALMWLHQSRLYSSSCTWFTLLKTTLVRCYIDTMGKKLRFDSKRWQEYIRWVFLLSTSDSAITQMPMCVLCNSVL